MKKTKPAFRTVEDLFGGIIPAGRIRANGIVRRLAEAWPSILPPGAEAAAGGSRPLDLDGRVLTIGVDNTLWAAELGLYRKEILARIAAAAPDAGVREIRFDTTELRRDR